MADGRRRPVHGRIDMADTYQPPASFECGPYRISVHALRVHLGLSVGVVTAECEARTPSAVCVGGWTAVGIGIGIGTVTDFRSLVGPCFISWRREVGACERAGAGTSTADPIPTTPIHVAWWYGPSLLEPARPSDEAPAPILLLVGSDQMWTPPAPEPWAVGRGPWATARDARCAPRDGA